MSEENGAGARGYVLFVWSPTGYSLQEREGELPRVGDEIDDGDLIVTKVGVSPFPGDGRLCVYSMGKG